jgi:transcriptional regulator with XRE-family HTH domain
MNIQEKSTLIRSRKLGILINDARLFARKTIEECALAINVKKEDFQEFERGNRSPSLPQLEVLAYYFDLPLDHFWGNIARSENPEYNEVMQPKRLITLRQKYIGVAVRQVREEKDISHREFAEAMKISETELKSYETGTKAIPVPLLDNMLAYLDITLAILLDRRGQIGKWYQEQKAADRVSGLPNELRDFIIKPVNQPYIELAKRLSELPTNKLRNIAENLLEITY